MLLNLNTGYADTDADYVSELYPCAVPTNVDLKLDWLRYIGF